MLVAGMASRLALSALRQPTLSALRQPSLRTMSMSSRLALSALRLRQRPQQRRGIVAEAAQLMCAAQDATHLPWWATITTTTIAARLALTPTTILARRAGRRLAVAAPHARRLTQLAVESIKANPAGRVEAARLYATGLHGLLKLHRANPLLVALPPVATLPTLVTLALAVRELPAAAGGAYAAGGALWFPNLAASDPTLVLPALAVGAAYANLERALGGRPPADAPAAAEAAAEPRGDRRRKRRRGRAPAADAATPPPPRRGPSLAAVAKNVGQLALIAAVPLTAQLPAGFCVFWLSSTAFTATQGEVLRRLDAAPVRPP